MSLPGWVFCFLRSSSTSCQQHPKSRIQFSLKKNEKLTPATAAFVALPHCRQPSSSDPASSYLVPKILLLDFVAVMVAAARGMVVARAVVVVVVAIVVVVALVVAVVVALAVAVVMVVAVWLWQWWWQW